MIAHFPAPRIRRLAAAGLVAALALTACTGSDAIESTSDSDAEVDASAGASDGTDDSDTDDGSTDATTEPPRSGDSVRSVVQSSDGDLTLEVASTEAEIWGQTNRDDVCSPVEPAVVVFEAQLDGPAARDVAGIRAFFEPDDGSGDEEGDDVDATTTTSTTTVRDGGTTSTTEPDDSSGRVRRLDFSVDEDGTWRVVVGPFPARSRADRPLAVSVVARTDDGVTAETELDLVLKAPVRCRDGERPGRDRRTPPPVELSVSTSPADGIVVGRERADCAGRPTTLGVQIEASGAVVAMAATVVLPDGSTVSRSADVRGGRRASLSFGPFPSPPVGASASVRFTVTATDVYGTTAERAARATLVRPEPCDEDGENDEEIDGTTTTVADGEPGSTTFSLAFVPASPVVWATGNGRCPAGATTFAIELTAPDVVTSVSVTTRTANGTQSTTSLTRSGSSWRGTLGPFAGWAGMSSSSTLGVRVTASGGGETRTVDGQATLRRSDACGSTSTTSPPATTAPPGSTPATTSPATTAPPSTAAPTTAAPTTAAPTTAAPTTAAPTTAPPPPPPQITNAGAQVDCGRGVRIGVQTAGTVTRVGVSLNGNNAQLGGGPSSWSQNFPLPPNGSYTATVRAEGAGQSAQSGVSFTVSC